MEAGMHAHVIINTKRVKKAIARPMLLQHSTIIDEGKRNNTKR